MQYQQTVKHFKELTTQELYMILQLRSQVFVVEQHCAYQDLDNKDYYAYHLCLYENKELLAYARLLPAGISYDEVSIGRVVTSPKVRGTGLGASLMSAAVAHCDRIFGQQNIQIGAQFYAKEFYERFGFREIGDIYDEDGIDHIHMIRFAAQP